jgi:hypothetical protein
MSVNKFIGSLQSLVSLRIVTIALILMAGCLALSIGSAHASSNLPLHHWAYEAIERLNAMGLINHAMLVTKPYSRKEAARYVGQMIEQVRTNQITLDGREEVAERLLARLRREFRPELESLGILDPKNGRRPGALRYGARLQSEYDAFFVGGGQTVRFRENRGGEYYANSAQNQTDIRGWLELGDWAAITLDPKYISDPNALGIGATNNTKEVYLREGNVKLSQWNVALEVGRGTQWWGPGYRGTLMLSDHAFPLDMIRLYSDEPFRLPGKLAGLGEWKVNSFITQLDRDREFPRTKVFGLRISYLPVDWLEMGLTRMTQFDGRGNTGGDQTNPIAILFDAYTHNTNEPGVNKVNEQAMFDFRMRLPKTSYLVPFPAGMMLYGELGLEDPPNGAATVFGIYVPQLFENSNSDLRFEFADTDIRRQVINSSSGWYNNAVYQSGMRYRGFPLGHWIGTDGIDFFLRGTHYLSETIQVGGNVEYEERERGLPIHEKRREVSADISWWVTSHLHLTAGYTYQRLTNPGQITSINPFIETFTPMTASNNFLWTTVGIEF